jgi:CheY-like chemotaxis protein
MLRKYGCVIAYAENGRQALTLLSQKRFPLVLMDCQMPELDGFEATRQIRSAEAAGLWGKRPRQFIVAMTANAMEGDRERCLAAGMDDYVSKPMQASQLEAIVRRAREGIRSDFDLSPENAA